MINLSTNTKLNIILPNTNKALAQAIKSASPQELQTLSQDKDLKSIMNSLLKQASQGSSSDKTLLNLVKNNPTLKNLGSIDTNIKDLLTSLKTDKNPLPIEKQLQKFLVDIKDVKESILKEKITNSGVFLESKLKNVQNPQVELKSTLEQLTKLLDKSKNFNVTVLSEKLKEVLQNPSIKNASNKQLLQPQESQSEQKNLQELVKKVQTLVPKLQEHIKTQLIQSSSSFTLDKETPQILKDSVKPLKGIIHQKDVIFSKDVSSHLHKLSQLSSQTQLNSNANVQDIKQNDLKAILNQAHSEISKSEHPNKQELLKHIDKLALQIDYNQLVSHLSNASSVYVPFAWDEMKEGQIEIKKDKDDKFYVDIDLKLKEYGALNLKLTLYEENQLNIQIHSDNKKLQTLVKENIPSLRSALIENQITPREIHIFDVKQTQQISPYESSTQNIDIGFEVKA